MFLALRIYIVSALVMLPLDAAWLTLAAEPLYRAQIGHLLREGFALAPAAAFYAIYVLGILVLAQRPSETARGAAARGAALGFVAYATFDLTNQAVMRDWPLMVTIIDLAWGTALTAAVSGLGFRLSGAAVRR